jgi:transcriptional regulator with XRE-family HTH domain
MHWLQTIRQHLQLSQGELAGYLGLSLDAIKSVEMGRRQLPMTSLRPAMIIFQTIVVSQAGDSANNLVRKTDPHARRRKHLRDQYQRRLNLCECRLEAMQHAHAMSTAHLGIYLHVAQSLNDESDATRRKWVQRKIEETTALIEDNDTDAQDSLHVQINVLKDFMDTLEEREDNDHPDTPT